MEILPCSLCVLCVKESRNFHLRETGGTPVLSFVHARIRQGFQSSTSEDFRKLVEQFVMDQAIRGQGFAAVDFERGSVKARNFSAGLFHDKHSSSGIPWIEAELPETIEAARSHVA